MFVLHTHWQPPKRPADPGGMLFWAENSEAPEPPHWRGRLPKKMRLKSHPFCLPAEDLRERIGLGTPLGDARVEPANINFASTRSGPIPSPDLRHGWNLDENRPFLAPWTVNGLWLPASKAFSVLVNLPVSTPEFCLGIDAIYWLKAANLVLETLSNQKLVPGIVPANGGTSNYLARWLPLLDGPTDGSRLAQLVSAMPPICRAELPPQNARNAGDRNPAAVLDSFVKSMCDALVRAWGRSSMPRLEPGRDDPYKAWVQALYNDDPVIHASAAQQQALASSLNAWLRNLQAAGDATFRITFQLESPEQQSTRMEAKDWRLRFMLQARDDPSLLIPAEDVWRARGNVLTLLGKRFNQPQEKMLAGLGYAARIFPPLRAGLQTSCPSEVFMDNQTAYMFMRHHAPLLEQSGFGLLTPPWWNKAGSRLGVRLRLKPRQEKSANLSSSKLSLENLVEYQWELSLGETTLSRDEFETLAALKQPFVQVRGQWVQLEPDQIEAALKFWESQKLKGEVHLLQAAQMGLDESSGVAGLPITGVDAEGWVAEWMDRLSHSERMSVQDQPQGLNGELRPYQRFGYSWLAFFRRWGLGACLADDMGLGKTIQTLALLLYEKETRGKLPGPVLLVCPTSVVTNWEREVRRFAPGLTTLLHQGPTRLKNSEFSRAARSVDLVLSSYAVVRQDVELISKVKWYGVVLDEAQNIKNSSAKQTQAVRGLTSEFRLALTGTPVENRLSELWSIMQFLNPGYLGQQSNFRQNYAIPIERFGDQDATRRLKQVVGPFILRRVKSDPRVIQDLPDKIEMKEYCTLTEEQASLYQAVVKDSLAKVAESDGMARRGLVLSMLMQLKQICNHPIQFFHQVEGGSALNLSDVNGRSGKLARLSEMLEEVISEGDRAVIFTQFAQMGHILASYLPQALGRNVLYLHGGTPARVRDSMVHRFQEEEHGPPIFILSLKAGGTGINLTRATHVFHFDRWWNPAVENQATDRTYRIGQSRNVQVHKFITTGTLEEHIDDLIESKRGLAETILGSGESWLTELSTDDLRDLVRLRSGD